MTLAPAKPHLLSFLNIPSVQMPDCFPITDGDEIPELQLPRVMGLCLLKVKNGNSRAWWHTPVI